MGREPELAGLARLLDDAAAGRGSVVMISGEAGIGKSRLADDLIAVAAGRGFTALSGHCYEGEGDAPYIAFAEALDAAALALPADTLRRSLGRSGPELARLVPRLEEFVGASAQRAEPPADERPYLFRDVRDFLHSLSQDRPVLLVLENLHWAQVPTVLLLRHLSQSVGEARIVIAGTYRDSEVDALSGEPGRAPPAISGFLDELHRVRPGYCVQLRPLAGPAVAAMIRSIAGQEAPPAAARAIYEHTEGNPFFVEETVRHLVEEGRLFTPEGGWNKTVAEGVLGVPQSLRRVIGRRLLHIDEDKRKALTTAAVIGRTFSYALLREVAGQPDEAILDCLDEAERARLIESGDPSQGEDSLRFSHEMIRQTLLTQVSLPRRRGIHLALVRAIEAKGGEELAAELARHSLLAGPAADSEATVRYLILAAEQASAGTAYEEAARLYREAVRRAPEADAARRCDLFLRLGEAEKRYSDSEDARQAFRAAASLASRLGDAEKLGRAALGFARTWPTVGMVDEEAVAMLREAVGLNEDATALRAELLSRLSLQLYYAGDPERVKGGSAAAVQTARDAGDRIALAHALQVRHVALWEPQHLNERIAIAREIIAISEETGLRHIALWGQRPLIADLMESGDTEAAEALSEAYSGLAEDCRQPMYVWQAAVRRAMLPIFRGRLAEGEKRAGEALSTGQLAGGQNLMIAFGEQVLVIRWLQGRLKEMESLARASAARQPRLALWQAVLAFICGETGNAAEARAVFRRLAEDAFASLPRDDTRPIALMVLALACGTAGDRASAEGLHRELLSWNGRNIVLSEGVVCVGAAAFYLALLAAAAGRLDDAERHFVEAMEMNERTGARPWLALARFEFGKMLLSRRGPGDRKRAADLLHDALSDARQLGMKAVEANAATLLSAHKARLAAQLPDGLTGREAQVLRLIATGMSNRDISEALVLSLRTTARHVTNIYGKIGARNRADATAYAIRNGLLNG